MKEKIKVLVAMLLSALFLDSQAIAQTMVLIPSGTFTMGSPNNEGGRVEDEGPQHAVTMSQAFYMSATEITKSQWDTVRAWGMQHGYTDLPVGRNGYKNASGGDHPVTEVAWFDIMKWCNARSEMEELAPFYTTEDGKEWRTGWLEGIRIDRGRNGYRLPTEAQWEYVCRARTTTAFSTGPITVLGFECVPVDQYLDRAGWYCGNSGGDTHPVGRKQPNAWGLYDMHGNAWEWTGSFYGPYDSSPKTDPLGAMGGDSVAIRGGSFDNHPQDCRAAYRFFGPVELANNLIGFRIVLPMAGSSALQTAGAPTAQTTYGACPEKQEGKDSLVVVTHGWIPKKGGQTLPPDPTWVNDMVDALINNVIVVRGQKNWQVESYKWKEKAWIEEIELLMDTVLRNGGGEGTKLGQCLAAQGWSHIHLIGHSAGAAVIQSALEAIKDPRTGSPSTVVHVTFLDAYVGLFYRGRAGYGVGADWADNYSSRDSETGSPFFGYTQGSLEGAYNVDVTWLDESTEPFIISHSTSAGIVTDTCYYKTTSHDWPHEFYRQTVLGTLPEAKGFGFPLSKEGGGWDVAKSKYLPGNKKAPMLGNPNDPPCEERFFNETTPMFANPFVGFANDLSMVQSPTGTKNLFDTGFSYMTESPVWVAKPIEVTNAVNFITFEAAFTSAKRSEGLLSVYWGTNTLGSLDERVTPTGLQKYTFPLPETMTNGVRMLGFRLDPFSPVQSSATVTNVALGFRGLREPFSLSFAGQQKDGISILQLNGPKGFNYAVESSTDLTNWTTAVILSNTDGVVRFTVPNNNAPARFYRAVAP